MADTLKIEKIYNTFEINITYENKNKYGYIFREIDK